MKKILQKLEKNLLLEYWRTSEGKFSVGNFIGINDKFAVFISVSPHGKEEGYNFIELTELKRIAKNSEYLKIIEEKIKSRNSGDRKTIILKKENFFKDLFKYFIKNKISIRVISKEDYINNGYLKQISENFFHFQWISEYDDNFEEIVKKEQIENIEIGKNVINDIIVEDTEIQKNKIIVSGENQEANIVFQDKNYILICENDLFWGKDENFKILKAGDVWEINEKLYPIETEDICLRDIFSDIANIKISEILKKCFEKKIFIHLEYEQSYYEKYGIIENFFEDRIIFKEIDKSMGIFATKSEVMIKDITFLYLRNFIWKD
ncbi:hypothetical protein [Pseudoleptotrichia goodfellowii]|uniref:Uncharacterized protein n=1 Tax=Pseudoleptotrichia goodfellowii TaxID=157692 RepID=A0A510JDZ8_9FUSO|nr:hypothetical protein [Pseudoleptotrichia goodfellowii]BBM36465.1 hypothetical protein JCM16774_1397 [Pseudoleptotrichia goodfellowii]